MPDAPADGSTRIRVAGPTPYDVVVGHGLAAAIPGLLGEGVRRVALLHGADLEFLASDVRAAVTEDYEVLDLPVPAGEPAKTAAVAAECWERLGAAGFTRSDAVVTVGGGATTDLGGFVAATWLRGVRVIHVPTTLLGMVDAAVGGKTGINTSAGKNLVGCFHEPVGVLCDLDHLRSLPEPERISGLAEVIKCGFIADPAILDLVETHDRSALLPGSAALRELVERAVRVKADVVAGDLRETAGAGVAGGSGHPGREVLNYGHTLAHAVEQVSGYRIRHGEAVAIGCVFVAELSRLAGRLPPPVAERHRRVLARVGLPVGYAESSFEDLRARMAVDKKTRGSVLRFVVLDDLARPGILTDPSDDLLRAAYAALAS